MLEAGAAQHEWALSALLHAHSTLAEELMKKRSVYSTEVQTSGPGVPGDRWRRFKQTISGIWDLVSFGLLLLLIGVGGLVALYLFVRFIAWSAR